MTHAGCFVVVEGPDGAGKTTLVTALAGRLRQHGIEPVVVREPGGTPTAEAIRDELLDPTRGFDPDAELLYIATARADLVYRVIRPAIEAGRLVLSDRFDLSTTAYQVAGRGIDAERARWLNRAATGDLVPDLTLVLDVPAAVGQERRRLAGKREDRVEREGPEFHERVAAAYLAANGKGVRHLDGTQPPNALLEAAWSAVQALLAKTASGGGKR